jgi:hypothetical protein
MVLLVRGLFGAWIPRHFLRPLQCIAAAGWPVRIAATRPAGTMACNARRLEEQLGALVAAGRRPIVLAHSKGGLEALLALQARPDLARATAGFVGVQMPRAGAPYLESAFRGMHRASRTRADAWRERRDAWVLSLLGGRAACAELDTATVAALAARFDAARWPFPWLTVASEAQHARGTLEMKHARLARIRPGAAHDGVFYTGDQVWSQGRSLVLAGLDHAQPSVGGGGFDHGAFWLELLERVAGEARAA